MKKILYITCISLLGSFMLGCEGYLDLNENPNTVKEPPINELMATATFRTAINTFNVGDFTSYYTQQLASPSEGSSYDTFEEVDFTGTWGGIYNNMTDIYDMQKIAVDKGSSQHLGVAKVLMAMNLSLAVDCWNNVPFNDAFTGDSFTTEYDDGKALYSQMLQMLDEGITELQKTDSELSLDETSDFIHEGSVENWIKTAYTLKARLLNHMSKQAEYDPAAILAAIDKGYTSNDDDAGVSRYQNRNPWAQVAEDDRLLVLGGWLSEQYVNHLNGTTYGIFDPRLHRTTWETAANGYVGTPNGVGNTWGPNNTDYDECHLRPSTFYASDDSPLQIITFAEAKFIEAEAAFRSGNKSRAYNAYLAGIQAHMDKLGVPADSSSTYITDPSVSVGAGNITLDLIMKEKYTAMFLNPEAWNDARRYDYNYKDMTLPEGAALPSFIRRLAYPSSETDRNGENVPSVELTDKIWWDQ